MNRPQNPQQNINKLDIEQYKKNNTSQQSGVYPEETRLAQLLKSI